MRGEEKIIRGEEEISCEEYAWRGKCLVRNKYCLKYYLVMKLNSLNFQYIVVNKV